MSTLTSPQYPFDPTGQAATNRVTGELQPLTGSGNDFAFLIPVAAPFFGDSIVNSINFKSLQGDIRPFVFGVDFYLSHYFLGASQACGKPVYGSITVLNTSLRGTLIFNSYQTLGGAWTVDAPTLATILADQVHNPRTTTWDQVAGYPTIFPPIPHAWNLTDMVGMSEVLDGMNRIVDAVMQGASAAMAQHIGATGNVHHLSASDIGAITQLQAQTMIDNAVQNINSSTDDLSEGDNKFFTENRVLQTKLTGFDKTDPSTIAPTDNLLLGLMKLQATVNAVKTLCDTKVNMIRPKFQGLGSQNLVPIDMTGTIAVDITLAEAYVITIKNNGAIGFDISKLGDVTGQVIEFSVTTINDTSGNAYAIAWPANVKWVDGTLPGRTTASGAKDLWYFVSEDGGVSWTGSLSNKNPL